MKLEPIYIVGPTASGKSSLALKLASKVDSIIISADSMQIYKGLDIGTAKVTKEETDVCPHKLIDVVNADEEFSVAEFADRAKVEIDKAIKDNKLPIIVGGTGLYFESLFYPLSFSNTIKDSSLRDELNKQLEKNGPEWLHDRLQELDPKTAERLYINDTKRVIRALEIIKSTGKTLDENKDERAVPDVICVGLNTDRAKLYEKINERVDIMFNQGLVQEVFSVGSFDYQSMQAIGYKEFKDCPVEIKDGKYFVEESKLNEIKDLIKQHTRNYAKRQITWFKKYSFIKWFDCYDQDSAIEYLLAKINE